MRVRNLRDRRFRNLPIIRGAGASGPKRSTNFSESAARVTTPPFVLWHTNGSESCFAAGKTENLIRMRSTQNLCSTMDPHSARYLLNLWKTREWIVKLALTSNLRCLRFPRRGGCAINKRPRSLAAQTGRLVNSNKNTVRYADIIKEATRPLTNHP